MTRTRRLRILIVTLLLGALGGLAGALGGAVIALGALAVVDSAPELGEMAFIVVAAAGVGGAFGVIVGPLLSWTMLRHVPIGRAILQTAIAAGLAATLSLMLAFSFFAMLGVSLTAAALAALRLRRRYPPTVREP
jgi:hypothetical protein